MTSQKTQKATNATTAEANNSTKDCAERIAHLDRMTHIVDELTYMTSGVRDILRMSVLLIEEHGGNHDLCVGACKALDVLRRQMDDSHDLIGDLEVGLRDPFARLVALEAHNAQ